MTRALLLLTAMLCAMPIQQGHAQNKIKGIVDVKLTDNHQLEGYEKIRYWQCDKKKEKLYLYVKYGEAARVLTDIVLYNKGAGDIAAVGCPDGYENIGYWDTTFSVDAFGTKNRYNISLCVKYGSSNPVKSVLVKRGNSGEGLEAKGVWFIDKDDYHLFIGR